MDKQSTKTQFRIAVILFVIASALVPFIQIRDFVVVQIAKRHCQLEWKVEHVVPFIGGERTSRVGTLETCENQLPLFLQEYKTFGVRVPVASLFNTFSHGFAEQHYTT